jgi:DivIVA domain-containing protein
MGLHEVAGWLSLACGVVGAGGVLRRLRAARRGGAGFRAVPLEVWAWLLTSLGVLASGILYLHYPRYPHGTWLNWIPPTFATAGIAVLIVAGIAGFRRIIRDSSAPGPEPEPTVTIDDRTADLIERIKNARFGTTRLGQGYDEEEVDVFLDKLVAVLSGGGQLHHSELRAAQFSRTRLRPGYVMADVVAFLDQVAQAA